MRTFFSSTVTHPARSFLRDQLGEAEMRALLEHLQVKTQGSGQISVEELYSLAGLADKADKTDKADKALPP
jgi:hypothetical protein